MNKTLLLIICDFLLLNLLALTNWETAQPTTPPRKTSPITAKDAGIKPASAGDDLMSVMQMSLDDEREQRRRLAQELAQARATLAAANTELQSSIAEKQRIQEDADEKIHSLNTNLQSAEMERSELREEAEVLKGKVADERKDRVEAQKTTTVLAENVEQLAKHSSGIAKNVRESQPVSPNTIARSYFENAITLNLTASRPGMFGMSNKKEEIPTVFIVDQKGGIYAVTHVRKTPFDLTETPKDWTSIGGVFSRNDRSATGVKTLTAPFTKINFLKIDPRIVAFPITLDAVKEIKGRAYRVAAEPFKFNDGIFITNRGRGVKVAFEYNPDTPGYVEITVQVDNPNARSTTQEQLPERGDLIFSGSGEILGIMVNHTYCVLIANLDAAQSITPGNPAPSTSAAFTELGALYKTVPSKVR